MQSTPFAQYQTHAHTHVLVTHTIAPSWHMMMAAPWRAAPCSCCSLSCALLSSAYWVTRSAHAFAHLVSYVSRPHARMRACSRLHARTSTNASMLEHARAFMRALSFALNPSPSFLYCCRARQGMAAPRRRIRPSLSHTQSGRASALAERGTVWCHGSSCGNSADPLPNTKGAACADNSAVPARGPASVEHARLTRHARQHTEET